jgi:hypothetical protein
LCILNKKNRLLIKQDSTLFNIRAKTHIAKLIDDFIANIYTLVSLLVINTANKKARLLGFSKKTLIYITDINKKTYILNFSKV